MFCAEGRLALFSFLATCSLIGLIFVPGVKWLNFWSLMLWGPVLYFIFINLFIRYLFRGTLYQMSVRAALLGFVFASGAYTWSFAAPNIQPFGLYMCILSLFHFTEFLIIAIIKPNALSIDSFVMNNNVQYTVAAMASWLEFWVETWFFPDMKVVPIVTTLGVAICLASEYIRKLAMLTAWSNFDHLVQNVKRTDHQLVTHGIYSFWRHPSYVGWFYWAIGTQIILLNPICGVIYPIVSWMFFRERIFIEEITLLNFFGQDYLEYQKKVSTGLPFINGYQLNI